MKKISLVLILVWTISGYSQFGIGKDIVKAKSEIKGLLIKNAFNFIEEEKDNSTYTLLFKEGFNVNLSYDKYKNCSLIQIIIDTKNKEKMYQKLLKIFNSSKWIYKSNEIDWVGKFNFYEFEKIFIKTKEYANTETMSYSIIFYEK